LDYISPLFRGFGDLMGNERLDGMFFKGRPQVPELLFALAL
jgi:hypothetical protein